MDEAKRQELLFTAVQDKNSLVYRAIVNLCRESDAASRRAIERSGAVVVPFDVEEKDVAALEAQFGVVLKLRPSVKRMTATTRVAGMVFLLDAALHEHSTGPGRTTLFLDGDVMTLTVRGLNGKIVERTNALPRLATGYFREDEQIRSFASNRSGAVNRSADLMMGQLKSGGGENFFPTVRADGPRVTVIVVNHFKTPAPPHQLAWLANCRGSVVYGAIFFQPDMLVKDSGDLVCFPGRYYIDRANDLITLVPDSDATFSISHSYSAWHSIISLNSITVGGKEYLCEKYKSVPGIVYYTLVPINSDFEVPETLRSHFFDRSLLGVTKIKYPKVQLSDVGVPIGYERSELLVNTSRLESVLSRLLNSANDVIKPAEAFAVLMDHNNTAVVSLDHTATPERMPVGDENELAMALALHVNFLRHTMRGTFKAIVHDIRQRHNLAGDSLYRFTLVIISAWFRSMSVASGDVDEIPMSKVVDRYGNDFSIMVEDADPWIEFTQVVGEGKNFSGQDYNWLPPTPKPSGWLDALYAQAVKAVGLHGDTKSRSCKPVKPTHNQLVGNILRRLQASSMRAAGLPNSIVPDVKLAHVSAMVERDNEAIEHQLSPKMTLVDQGEKLIQRPDPELTEMKQTLFSKMLIDQGSIREEFPHSALQCYQETELHPLQHVPVVTVEPISAMISDLEMCNGGPMERDVTDTGYRISEVDVHKSTEGMLSINDAKRIIPSARWVRKPIVNSGSEGKRIATQAALLGAVFKRNVGVPANRGSVDLSEFPSHAVSTVIDVCYRDDWEAIVQKHLNAGMWESNNADVEAFIGKLDEKKVKKLLDEFFLEGVVELDRWMLMMKGKIKASREPDSVHKVDHSQTILYLDTSSVNAMYSAMTSRFKLCMAECMRPEISISAEESDEEHERWYNSLDSRRSSFGRTYSYSVDIKCYDRSQDHVALRVDLEWYKRHGLSQERLDIWSRTHGAKKAISMMFGVVLTMTQQGLSGDWKTLMRNSVVNLAALVFSMRIQRSDVVMIDIKGDDADIEVAKPINVSDAVDCMSRTFNMSAKPQSNDVRYMCKQFRLKISDRWIFVADPWARVQSVNTPLWMGNQEDTLKERWISLNDALRHYDNGIVVDAVAEAAQTFYGVPRPLYGMARALSVIKSDFSAYSKLFGAPEQIS